MANNRVQYTIGVNADTSAAQKQLSQLQTTLKQIQDIANKKSTVNFGFDRAAESAKILEQALQKAVNVDTGKLNLSKFNTELKSSGSSVQELASNLVSVGGEGSVAFTQLASAIAGAEVPIKRMNSTLQNFATTLKNTVKWEISSKMVHSVESFFTGAISYAKDLNETLNNIRIVTGQSIGDMANFTKQANQMARELSATTQDVAKASLIYYQQGDSAELAAKKAATTIKAANVAFTASAQEMSEMLTAVWNSYQVGEEQLEHTVDIMAALGATTASSMEEMAGAMQKVAATANTVGVSMEQMAAMVATSASVTRQAPQIIGTAWNTILSRLGGLKLGETLEDGTDLNKYSKALLSIGVNIKDQTGNLRDMGDVINDIGEKWEQLDRSQKSALAQTVGGARQYTQILAFFENFDKYQANMQTALNSTGELDKQAKIYAESWEAAAKRQKAALEGVFNEVINDEAIIKITNSLTGLINVIGDVVKGFGGVQGILLTIGNIGMKVFGSQITQSLDTLIKRTSSIFGKSGSIATALRVSRNPEELVRDSTGRGKLDGKGHYVTTRVNQETGEGVDAKTGLGRFIGSLKQQGNYEMRQQRAAIQSSRAELTAALAEPNSQAEGAALNSAQNLLNLKERLLNTEHKMSTAQQQAAQAAIDAYGRESQKLTELIAQFEKLEASQKKAHKQMATQLAGSAGNQQQTGKGKRKTVTQKMTAQQISEQADTYVRNAAISKAWEEVKASKGEETSLEYKGGAIAENGQTTTDWNSYYQRTLGSKVGQMSALVGQDDADKLQNLYKEIGNMAKAGEDTSAVKGKINELIESMKRLGTEGANAAETAGNSLRSLGTDGENALNELDADVDELVDNARDIGHQQGQTDRAGEQANQTLEEKYQASKFAKGLAGVATAAMSATASFSAMQNTIDTLSDKQASFSQKATSVISTVGNLATAWSQGLVSGIAATVATAASAVIGYFNQVAEAEREKRQRTAAAIKETAENLKKDQDLVIEASENFDELKKSFEAGELSRAEYVEKLTEITSSLEIEGTSVAALTQNYEALEQAIQNATDKRMKTNAQEALAAYNTSRAQVRTVLQAEQESDGNSPFTIDAKGSKDAQIVNYYWTLTDQSGLKGTSAFNTWKSNHGINDDDAAMHALLFGDTSGVKRGEGSNWFEGRNDLYFTADEPTLVAMLKRMNQVEQYAADRTNPDHQLYNDIIGTEHYRTLKTYIENTLAPLRTAQQVAMTSTASQYTGSLDKTDVAAQIGEGTVTRESVIQGIMQSWTDAGLDMSLYGEEDARQIAEQYADAYLASFPEYAEQFAREKDTNALQSAVFTLIDQQFSPKQAEKIKKYIQDHWDDYFKDLFSGMDMTVDPQNFLTFMQTTGFDFLDSDQAPSEDPRWQGFQEWQSQYKSYNAAVQKYDLFKDYAANKSSVGVDSLPNIMALLDDKDIARFFGGEYESKDALQQAINNGADKTEILKKILNGIEANLLIYYDELAGPAKDLQDFLVEQIDNIEKNWRSMAGISDKYKGTKLGSYLKDYGTYGTIQDLIHTAEGTNQDTIALESIDEEQLLGFLENIYGSREEAAQALADAKNENGYSVTGLRSILSQSSGIFGAGSVRTAQGLQAFIDQYGTPTAIKYNPTVAGQRDEEEQDINKTKRANSKQDVSDLLGLKLDQMDIIDSTTQNLLGWDQADVLKFKSKTAAELDQAVTDALETRFTAIKDSYGGVTKNEETGEWTATNGETIELEDQQWLSYLESLINERTKAAEAAKNTEAIQAATEAYTKYQTEIQEANESATKQGNAATILAQNITTGQLSEAQKAQIAQSGLNINVDDYVNAADATERAAIAANAWSQYLIEQEAVLEKQQKLYNNVATIVQNNLDTWDSKYLDDQIEDVDKFIVKEFGRFGPAIEGQVKAIFDQMQQDGIDTSKLTYEEAFRYLAQYSNNSIAESQNAFDLIKANGIDSMKSLWESASAAEKAAADKAVSDWETAFDKISKARQAMLKGEDINSQIGSFEDYTTFLERSGLDEDEFNRRLLTGEQIDFALPSLVEHQELVRKASGLSEDNYDFTNNTLLQKHEMRSKLFKRAQDAGLDNEDDIEAFIRTEALAQIKSILRSRYGTTKDDTELDAMAQDYWDHWSQEKWDELGQTAQAVDSRTQKYSQYTYREEQQAEAQILKEAQLEQKTTAYDLIKTALSDSTVRDQWWQTEALTETDLQDLADAMGITVDQLKNLSWEEIEAKYQSLAVQIDNTETEFSKFQAALAAGEFDNRSLSNYTTLEGERIWTDESHQLDILTEQGFSDLTQAQEKYNEFVEDALAEGTEFAGTVVQGKDGKYYIVEGGQVESDIISPYSSSVTPQTTYQNEAATTLETAHDEYQSAWRSKINSDASALDTVQLGLKNGNNTAANWQALDEQLDLTNPKIAEAYENFRLAGQECESMGLKGAEAMEHMRDPTNELTTALLEQGGVILEDNAVNNDFLKTLYDEYQIGDDLGNAFTVQSLNAMRAKTSLTALKAATETLNKSTVKSTKNTKYSSKTFKDLRKELKADGKTMEDYVKDNKNLSDEEKDLMRDTDQLMDTYEDLGKQLGLSGDDLDDFVDKMMDCESTSEAVTTALEADATGIVKAFDEAFDANNGNNTLANAFDNWKNQLGTGANDFISSAAAMLNMTEADVTTLMDKCTNAIAAAGGDLTAVDWGTLANSMGVDISTILTIMQEYLRVLQQANAIEGFDVSGLIGQLQKAISAAQSFQGKHGGGGGATNGTPASSDSGGGGGGSSKSAKKVEDVKRGVDEKERYHEITEQLERQSKVLERLDKLKSRAFGANKLKAIQNEIDALEKESELYEKQAAEAAANADVNKTLLQQYGATFNDDGTVNYDEYMDKIIERYNEAVEKYNSSEQTAADELMLKEAEEKYEEAKKALEDYEEDLDKLEEAQNNFLENQNKISAAKLEGIQHKVEVKLDLNDRDIKLLQYFRDKWEDLFQMQDESMRYMTEEALKYESNLKTLGTAMDELNAAYGNGTLNQADYATGMQDVNDKMVEQLNNLLTIKKSIKEAYGETLSKAKEEIEKYTAVLDHSHSVLEQYIEMQQLMGLGADYSGLQKMYQVSYDSSVANVKAAKDYLEVLKNSKEQIEANAAEHGWTEELKQQWADVNAEIQEGEDNLLSYTNQALTDAQNLFSNTMQAIVQDFDEQLFGMKNGLSDLEDDYEYYQEEQARYLSTSKELYEVSKLNRQINDSIADSTTKASKERLKALQEQIKAQSESTRLTEYDVQMMELQYKYALALDDLENAKNAKSTVRLTRDENGNYGYQYTADDDKISESQQKVEDVLQQINELAAERVNEIEQSAVQAEREYRDALLEIASDTTLTLEERQQKMEELTRRYSETMQYNQEQYGNATSALLTNQQYVYDRYGESILENTGMIQDQMNISVAAMIEKTASYGTFLQEQLQPGGQIYDALQTYKDNIGIVTNTSGLNSWEDMVASSKDFEEANKAAAAELENINDQLGETLTNISDVTDKWLDHADVLDSVISKYEELAKASADAVRAAAGNMDGESPEATSGAATKEELENIEKQWMYSWSYNGYSGTWSGYDSRKAALKGAKSDIYQKIMSSLEAGETDEETASNRAKLQDEINAALQTIEVTQYLSGGLIDYTGPAWVDGSLGRPEMILNADDTQKMMNIVDTLHDLDVGVINDLYHSVVDSAMSYLYSLSSLTPGTVNTQSGELQQNVHIEADFPNVTDRNEIVDAFNDLVNMASQYANRR